MNVINKFKLYKYKVKLNKYKLIKGASITLVPVMLVTSIGAFINNREYDKHKNKNNYQTSYYSHYNNEYNSGYSSDINGNKEDLDETETNLTTSNVNEFNLSLELDDYSKQIIDSNISLSTLELNNYINEINNIEIQYKYADIYNTETEFLKYQSINKYKSTAPNLFKNGVMSSETLFNIVKENNNEIYNSSKVSDSDLRVVCDIIANLLNDVVKTSNIDQNLLSEKLNDLKIVTIDEFATGAFDSETCRMGFDFTVLKTKGKDQYKQIVEHETYHFLQANSLNEQKSTKLKNRYGFTYDYQNDEMNFFNWNWFYEGCASYLVCNRNNTKEPTAYGDILKDIDTIKVSTVLMNNNSVSKFENLSLSTDINDLFNYLDCKTEKEKIEALNMMFSINLKTDLLCASDGFRNKYKEIYGTSILMSQLRKELDDDIAQSLTKYFYKGLANSLMNKNIKVEEVFSMISVFENELSRNIWYDSNQSTLTEFYDTYSKVQSDLFQMIAKFLGVEIEEIQYAYNAYNNKVVVELDNVTILNNEQKYFYSYILSTRRGDKRNTINYVFESMKACKGDIK